MFKTNKPHLLGKLHVFLAFFMVMAVVMGTQPADIAQADNTIDTDGPNQHQNESFLDVNDDPDWRTPPPGFESEPAKNDVYPFSYMDTMQPQTSYSHPLIDEGDVFFSEKGIKIGSDGTLPLPSSTGGGSLPVGIDSRSLFPGITVDLTYHIVMGDIWDDRGETVIVTMGADGYGAAVVDDTGFFWTPIWHATDGYPMDIDCDMTISVVVGTDPAINITPPCLTGGIDILNETAYGSIAGDTGGTSLLLKEGYFNPELDEQQRLQAQPTQGGGIGVSTLGDGSFSYDYASARQFNFGAETLIQVDYQVVGGYARTYLYPDTSVFMIQQYSIIGGYADIGQLVTATVYEGSGPSVRWSDSTNAYGPHGLYTFTDVPILVGDDVEVVLNGGPTLSSTAVGMGDFNFDTAADTLTGTAPDGADVRASLWQWVGLNHWYRNLHVLATSGDTFTMDFSTDPYIPVDLRPRDDVLVVVEDVNGNQVQVLSGPAFLSAYISLDTNLDCVYGRLYAPGLPIVVSLDKGGGEVYTRDPGHYSDVGNRLPYCYLIKDGDENVDFSHGDLVRLENMGVGYTGQVSVVDFAWSGDTLNNDIIGSISLPIGGDIEVSVSQWQGDLYPAFGVHITETSVSGGNFTAPFIVDIRDGVMIDFSFYNVDDEAVETNSFGYRPTLPYFELQLPFGVGGMAGSPGETVTARLYDGATLLAETSDDGDDDPYRYWLDDFGEHSLQPGYRVEVSTSGGWSGEMVIPDLSIEGDLDTDMLTANGPAGLLYLEVNNNWGENLIVQFVPGSPAKWDLSLWGWDLLPSDWVSVTYQAVDGNRAYYGVSMAEVSHVNLWLDYGANDWMWGSAEPDSTVTAERGGNTLFTTYADPACGGCWDIEDPLDINPGDVITVTAGAGVYPVTVEIPDPLTAYADAATDEVWGQIDGWLEQPVEVYGNWEDGYREIETDASGDYSTDWVDPYTDIPMGGDGYIRFTNMSNWAYIYYHQYFREPSLLLNVNYGHDWIEGWYPPGHSVTLTVTESDGVTVKGTAEMVTGEIPWWGGGTGFSTSYGDPWIGAQPDILPGDWVFGEVDVEGTIYSAEVRIGTITGEIDITTDSITGTIDVPWLPQDQEVEVWCHPYGAPEGVDSKSDMVLPDGEDEYSCSWDPATEWDVQGSQDIAVSYVDEDGHWVYNVFTGYSDELIMFIHYDHDWIDGNYEPGHDIHLTVFDGSMVEKAHITMATGPIDDWGGQSGFATYLEGVAWEPENPDIQPGDTIHGEVDDGSEFTADVEVGLITGTPNVGADSITGTVDADWLLEPPYDVAEVDVGCYIWENDGRNVYTSVVPNGVDTYMCEFVDENAYDIVPGTNLLVSYFEPDGHQIVGQFYVYPDELIMAIYYDYDSIEGSYEPGHEIHLTVYDNLMVEKASITIPTDPIDDWGGQSGFATWLDGAIGVPENFDIVPGDTIHGEVDDGSEFTADVEIGTITGDVDVGADSVSGTVEADWLMDPPYNVTEVDVGCHIWENDGRNIYTTVIPNGVDTYTCEFVDENAYNIVPGTNLLVSYFEPDGHQILADFSPPAPYLKIEKWFIGDGSPGVGGNAAFYVQYQNQGGLAAEDVTITDTLVGMTYLSDTSGLTADVAPGDQEVSWDLGTVDPSDDWIWFTVFAEVTASESDPISNTVEISTSSSFDMGDEGEKTSTWDGTVAANDTHLNVDKWPWTENPAPGEDYFYTVNVCNNGSTSSSTVTLTDTLPDATTYVDWWRGDEGWQESSQSGQILELLHTSISANTCSEVYIRVTLDDPLAEPGDELINHVEIAADNDLETEDNTAECHHQVGEPYVDLGIWQGWHWGSLVPGGYYRYGITFRNEGNLAVDGPIEVTATLPVGTSFADWDGWGAAESVGDPSIDGNELTWMVGDLFPGSQGTIEVWVDILPGTVPDTVLEHLAEIEIQAGEEYLENNSSMMSEMVNNHGPNLRIRKEGGVHGHGDGHNAWYYLYVENIGDETVNDVVITDYYPDGMELDGDVDINWDAEWHDNDPEDNALSVYYYRLEPGWSLDINYNMVIPGTDPIEPGLIYENTAQVMPMAGDVNPDDNETNYMMGTGPDMYVDKRLDSGEFMPGEQVSFLLEFGNKHHDNSWWWGMDGNAILTDILPDGMSYVSATMHWCWDSEWCEVLPDIDGQTLTWVLYPLDGNNWNEILLTVEIDSEIGSTNTLINQAMIASDDPVMDADPFPENNYSEFVPESGDSYIFLPLIMH